MSIIEHTRPSVQSTIDHAEPFAPTAEDLDDYGRCGYRPDFCENIR